MCLYMMDLAVWYPPTQAVAGGKWVIMEDVDAAPPDVVREMTVAKSVFTLTLSKLLCDSVTQCGNKEACL